MTKFLNPNVLKVELTVVSIFAISLLHGCSTANNSTVTAVAPTCSSQQMYQTMDTSAMCVAYWSNRDVTCDYIMIEQFKRRNVIYSSRSQCGQPSIPVSSPQTTQNRPLVCNIQSFWNFDAQSLCRIYVKNENLACDSRIRTELSSRSLKFTPHDECGQPLFKSPVQKKELTIPNNIANSCMDTIKTFTNSTEPLKTACDFRYKSVVRESITCRKHVNDFINLNSKGVGNNSQSCGLQ
jgi:hypothetical protein